MHQVKKGIHQLSSTTIFIGLFIVASASFTRQLMVFTRDLIGKQAVLILYGIIMAIFVLLSLLFIIKNRPGIIKILIALSILGVGIIFYQQIKIPEEKIHILEYALLGWLVARDLYRENNKNFKRAILASAVTVAAGIMDELFQAVLPYRYFDLRDIFFNGAGGACGIILYSLT